MWEAEKKKRNCYLYFLCPSKLGAQGRLGSCVAARCAVWKQEAEAAVTNLLCQHRGDIGQVLGVEFLWVVKSPDLLL